MKIGYIGNFVPPYSTENDRKVSFEKLGHTVIPYQEDKTTVTVLKDAVDRRDFDILFYSHTHGWEIKDLPYIFGYCKPLGVPTASVHLDKWAGLERERDIGKEATWYTEYLFMADFSPQAVKLYKKHNLNVHYLKAGVVQRDCYIDYKARREALDQYGSEYLYDVVFVGSYGYHKEYPFRKDLIDFLKETYKERFAHFGGDGEGVVRGASLNRLYAVSKIAVGDSCFAGQKNYVSDRYYETRGRGGFLLHPAVYGVDSVGVGNYKAQDLTDLQEEIEYWLSHDEERELMRHMGHTYVTNFETYTDRAREMLDIIYGRHAKSHSKSGV